jgi:hypothetical protein
MLRYILILASLLSGLIIYIGFRGTNTPIYSWVLNLGFENEVCHLRIAAQGISLPDWFIYSMPDGLWMFSFVLTVLSIWRFNLDKTTWIWIGSTILIGLGFELMQSFVKRLGVFDWMDLFLMIAGAAIALTIFSNRTIHERQIKINPSSRK